MTEEHPDTDSPKDGLTVSKPETTSLCIAQLTPHKESMQTWKTQSTVFTMRFDRLLPWEKEGALGEFELLTVANVD